MADIELVIKIPEQMYLNAKSDMLCGADILVNAIKNGIPRETVTEFADRCRECGREKVLDKIRTEITDCLKALDEIEKSGFNIYIPNEISGRRLTYKQCLEFIDKYKAETEYK